ncbi:MAG: GDSL-type esterase/lipase family protein, partial [Dehalococcoidia bacterium]
MNQRSLWRSFLWIVLALSAGGYAIACGSDDGDLPGQKVYVSLGDSVAAGNGASDARSTGFAAVLAQRRAVELQNFAAAGATTSDVIERQLDRALRTIEEGDVAFVTISAGGNDFAGLIPNASCVEDPLPASCPIDETLLGVEANLREILARIRKADADVLVLLLGYP